MSYTKTNWQNNQAPYLNATNLNKIEQGIDDAHADLENTPTGDTSNPQDKYRWTYDASSGGWVASPVRWEEIEGKPETYPPVEHSHAKLDRLPDIETSQRVVYVSPSGSDSTGSGTSGAPWKTIQYAINRARAFMQPINGSSSYKIILSPAAYNESVVIPPTAFAAFAFDGRGGIWLVSSTGVASDVVIGTDAGSSVGLQAYGAFTAEQITVTGNQYAINAEGGPAVFGYVKDCVLRRNSASDGGLAAINSSAGPTIHSRNNSSVNGQRFANGLRAARAALISKEGLQPSGTSAAENISNGGSIR